jgi:hypothetical protein
MSTTTAQIVRPGDLFAGEALGEADMILKKTIDF